jgi:hypothetical protein
MARQEMPACSAVRDEGTTRFDPARAAVLVSTASVSPGRELVDFPDWKVVVFPGRKVKGI